MNRDIQRSETEIVVHDRRRHLGSRSRQEEDMRPDAVVMLVRVIAGAALVIRMVGLGRRQVLVIALVCIVIVVVVFDRTDGFDSGMIVIARVRRHSGATAHEVLSNERDEHHL